MKKLLFIISLFSIITFMSCTESEDMLIKDNSTNYLKKVDPIVYHIYLASWDEWGRASKDCKRWGLCNYTDCWFCCTQGGVVVPCPKNENRETNSGEIKINLNTGEGFLFIKLDPSIQMQKEAIDNEKLFYVDEDIIKEKTILHKGVYIFDNNIGDFGGYKINISLL